jgi:catechol 2,3-dioxygenase-like lactoylglutathione lyase family enzyme
MFRNPDHITIAVADAESAIAFFALLGFRERHMTTIAGDEAAARYMGMSPGVQAQHITLELADAEPHFEIQLLAFEPVGPETRDELPTHRRHRGVNHIAFRVDDIAATTAHLEAHGVAMLNEELDYIGRKLRFFAGPEGLTLELVEWTGGGA